MGSLTTPPGCLHLSKPHRMEVENADTNQCSTIQRDCSQVISRCLGVIAGGDWPSRHGRVPKGCERNQNVRGIGKLDSCGDWKIGIYGIHALRPWRSRA